MLNIIRYFIHFSILYDKLLFMFLYTNPYRIMDGTSGSGYDCKYS